jgi:nucleotidyltransferase/DNA polymerase involved in DNA repair
MKNNKGSSEYKMKHKILTELRTIPGVGKVISHDLYDLNIRGIDDLRRIRADRLYDMHNKLKKSVQDRCMLYTFRCAIDYADKSEEGRKGFKNNWWDYKDK